MKPEEVNHSSYTTCYVDCTSKTPDGYLKQQLIIRMIKNFSHANII